KGTGIFTKVNEGNESRKEKLRSGGEVERRKLQDQGPNTTTRLEKCGRDLHPRSAPAPWHSRKPKRVSRPLICLGSTGVSPSRFLARPTFFLNFWTVAASFDASIEPT